MVLCAGAEIADRWEHGLRISELDTVGWNFPACDLLRHRLMRD
jgi:hypothetical protein